MCYMKQETCNVNGRNWEKKMVNTRLAITHVGVDIWATYHWYFLERECFLSC